MTSQVGIDSKSRIGAGRLTVNLKGNASVTSSCSLWAFRKTIFAERSENPAEKVQKLEDGHSSQSDVLYFISLLDAP